MSLSKFQLDFDPAETDCDQVKSYLSSSDGTLLTHTTLGAIEALDVFIANTAAITVDGEVSLDAATLAALENITITQGGNDLVVESDGSINVNASESGFSSCNYVAVSVANTATDLIATELANRKSITIQNLGTKPIYVGCDASVTTANGTKIPKGGSMTERFGAGINVHAITAAGTADVRIIELA